MFNETGVVSHKVGSRQQMKHKQEASMTAITPSTSPLTMSSLEIAELVNSRHDKVKQSIERLVDRGVIDQPPVGDGPKSANQMITKIYNLGKRDSYVVVAQLSPEFG